MMIASADLFTAAWSMPRTGVLMRNIIVSMFVTLAVQTKENQIRVPIGC